MSGTCTDCEHSKEPPCTKCEHCFVPNSLVYGSKFKRKCPLPRVGSKEWGWQYHKASNMHTTALSGYFVLNGDVNYYAEVRQRAGSVCIDGIESPATAKRIAELLARRDWRRENRGKK